MQRRTRPHWPAYALYGEAGVGPSDRLHCESIAERSRRHGWEILAHRHDALAQWLVVEQGSGSALLDGRRLPLHAPALVTVPALAVHGFVFAPEIVGQVFTLPEATLAAVLDPYPGLRAAALVLRGGALAAPAADEVLAASHALRAEALRQAPWRAAALDAAVLRLAVAIARAWPAAALPAPMPVPRALVHVTRLRALVEAQFRRQPTQVALAAQLGITPTQLSRACHAVLGHSAQGVLHARLLLQAQRELAYTGSAVKQIAFELGFSDAAYFTRFFRRLTGLSPIAWRAAAQRPGGARVAAERAAAGAG